MNSPLRVVLWACLLIGATPGAHAESISISIPGLYQSALDNSPQIRAHAQRMEALRAARQDAARLTAGPLTLNGSYRSDRNFDNQGLRETEIGISTPLWLWNERSQKQDTRQAEIQAAQARLLQQQLELAGEVRNVVWNTLAAHADVDIAQARQEAAKKLLNDVARRVNAGDLARADLLQASALHLQAQAEVSRAQAMLSVVGAEFTGLTGLPVGILHSANRKPKCESLPANFQNKFQAELQDKLQAGLQADQQLDMPFELQLDLQAHPVYQALQSEALLEKNRVRLVAIQSRENPEIGLGVVNERAAFAAPNERSLVVATRIPLGSSAEHQSRLLAAHADETEAQQKLKRAEITLKAQAGAALSTLQLFEKLRANAQEQAQLAQQVYAMYQQSFALGETDLPTLLGFEQQAFETGRMARKSDLEYSAKVSALRQALGLLPEQAP